MNRSYLDTEAPIAALATAPGESALAVIRAAGPGSVELVASLFSRPEALASASSHSLVHGKLLDPSSGEAIDEVLAAVFRGAKGPLGADSVELYCHGSPAVVRKALSVLCAAGFAPALPGEFSFRAFMNGKMDLVEAEAVQELVASGSEAERASALRRLEGGLSGPLKAARAALVDELAEAEARLDYAEDDDSPSGGLDRNMLADLRDMVRGLAASYSSRRLYEKGATVVIAGRPNAGKSSLFNLLLREERSIVAAEAGTTRDYIEAGLEIGGYPVRLIDTAGIREARGEAEAEGVARSLRLAGEADVLLYVVDGIEGEVEADAAFLAGMPRALRAWNKVDNARSRPAPEGYLRISAASGEGLGALINALSETIAPLFVPDVAARLAQGASRGSSAALATAPVASGRQALLLERAAAALDEALSGADAGLPLDALVLDLREAADALGETTGEIASAEVLEAVFSRFCLGK